jgi:cytoskeletal protein RodZ
VDDLSDQISERLKMEREAAGLSVEDVIFQTCIPRSVVVALEEGDFSVFSSPTYAKSFLSQYSSFLKVEAGPWLDALEPASFVPGETVLPLWESPTGQSEVDAAAKMSTPAWVSAIVWLVFSSALLFIALRSYAYFEERFGGEGIQPVEAVEKIETAPSVTAEPEPDPPRARVVRPGEF